MKSPIRKRLDMQRMREAMKGPGADTRTWASVAIASGEQWTDETLKATFVDVTLEPSGLELGARIAKPYAGSGFGMQFPVHAGDEVVVIIPSGDLGNGAIVVGRLTSGVAQEPDEAMSDPSDVTWYVEDGKRFVVATRGKVCSLTFDDGTVSLVNAGGSSVTLDGAGKRIVIQSETGAVLTMDAGFSFVGAIIAQAVSASSLAVSGASTVGGVNVALVGANVPMDAAWVTWLQGLAAAAAYAATMPTVAVGKVT